MYGACAVDVGEDVRIYGVDDKSSDLVENVRIYGAADVGEDDWIYVTVTKNPDDRIHLVIDNSPGVGGDDAYGSRTDAIVHNNY